MSEQESSGPIWLYALIVVCLLGLVGWQVVGARVAAQLQAAAEAEQAARQAAAAKKAEQNRGHPAPDGK
jgi:predicted negative regulator of RcsB-dependent stress response